MSISNLGVRQIFLCFCAIFGIGCQGKGDISGTVTCDGKPVPFGTVLVEASDGSIPQGFIRKDGTYSISGMRVGEIRVAVSSPDPKSFRRDPNKPLAASMDVPNWFPIPERYGSIATSELTYTIKPGSNTVNIELKKD